MKWDIFYGTEVPTPRKMRFFHNLLSKVTLNRGQVLQNPPTSWVDFATHDPYHADDHNSKKPKIRNQIYTYFVIFRQPRSGDANAIMV